MLPSELYAGVLNESCKGYSKCHWCNAPCTNSYFHIGPIILHSAPKEAINIIRRGAINPSNSWVCFGCHKYKNGGKRTLDYMGGIFKDNKTLCEESWFMTEGSVKGIVANQFLVDTYAQLLNPPNVFILSLLENGCDKKLPKHSHNHTCLLNDLHHCKLNEFNEIKSETPLVFTLNNIPFTYTIYELREAIEANDTTGTEPGVRELIRFLGPCPEMNKTPQTIKQPRGRPKKW